MLVARLAAIYQGRSATPAGRTAGRAPLNPVDLSRRTVETMSDAVLSTMSRRGSWSTVPARLGSDRLSWGRHQNHQDVTPRGYTCLMSACGSVVGSVHSRSLRPKERSGVSQRLQQAPALAGDHSFLGSARCPTTVCRIVGTATRPGP